MKPEEQDAKATRDGNFPDPSRRRLLQGAGAALAAALPLDMARGSVHPAAFELGHILSREVDLGTNASPGLKAMVEMAKWRINFIQWQSHADNVNRALTDASPPKISSKTAAKKPEPANTAMP